MVFCDGVDALGGDKREVVLHRRCSGRHAWQLGGWERNRYSKGYGTCSDGLARSPSVNWLIHGPRRTRESEERRTVRILSTHTSNHNDPPFHRFVCACSQTSTSFNGACNGFRFNLLFIVVPIIAKPVQSYQFSRLGGARRSNSTGTEPPPAGGHLPSIATSKILHNTREAALRTPGIKWLDEDGSTAVQSTIDGRETRKMNVYQAVRDAMGCVISANTP